MKNIGLVKKSLFTASLILGLTSCAESKFAEGTPSGEVPYEGADANPVVDPVIPPVAQAPVVTTVDEGTACPKESLIKNAFPAEVSACYESGRVWNFGSNSCVQMRAAEFACSWDVVKAELGKIGLKSGDVDKASVTETSRLVGCGQSKDKMRIVVQWINLPTVSATCEQVTNSGVVTGCFTNYGTATPPAPAANQAERDKRNYECMNTL